MSNWAELDENNTVIRVIVCDNNDSNGDEGYKWLIETYGGRWIQTSYNRNIRKNYAGEGYYYDVTRDAFIPPKLFNSWILDEDLCVWFPPINYPSDGNKYFWDEETISWVLLD